MPSDDEALGAPESTPRTALIPHAPPARPKRLFIALGALLPLFLLMACDRHFGFSVLLGALAVLVASAAVLDALGSFDHTGDADSGADQKRSSQIPSLRRLVPRLGELSAMLLGLLVALRVAVAGGLPWPKLCAAVLVTGTLVGVVISLFRLVQALRPIDVARAPLFERRGFWLVLLNVFLYVPLLGSYSLSDPWEAHYGEVAREMLARDDWISLWWAQDGWFWSKPVLDFWLQALGFSLTGVHFMPDQVLASAAQGLSPAPEWPARLPIFLLTVVATYCLYKAVAKSFGERAGLLAGFVLTTDPYWYLIAHQSMTDMPYVAPLTAALCLVVLGMQSRPEQRVRARLFSVGGRVIGVSGFHLLFGAILVTVLPQLVYLATRNVTLQLSAPHFGFRWHFDEFFSGSGGGNCGLPGNEECRWVEPLNSIFQPGLAALLWTGVLGLLLFVNRGERRVQRLYFLGAWYFTALSTLAKGAPGFVLPIVIALTGLAAARRYKDFARLELVGLALVLACVCLPWYVQMYIRHGAPFTDRLLFHDMYKRAFEHVHDTNTGDDVTFRYYVWQLGYGLFPWVGFGAAGLMWWLRFGNEAGSARSETMAFMALWFTLAFAMFTITLTKFHHYALPTVPPIAAVTGVLLDRALGSGSLARARRDFPLYGAGLIAGCLLALNGVRCLFPGTLSGKIVPGPAFGAMPIWGGVCIGAGTLLGAFSVLRFGALKANATDETPSHADRAARTSVEADANATAVTAFRSAYASAMLGFVGFASAIAIALVARDLLTTVPGDIDGPARLLHLFTYNYRRPWPSDSLDFRGVLASFTALPVALSLGFVVPLWRRHALAAFAVTAVAWTAWCLDVYLVAAAPHWGQRETILAYYAARRGPEEPFVAYQMNWKGENFYTGNRVPAFVSSGSKFKTWVGEQKKKGVNVMFFTTEHSRVSSLRSELGTVKTFKLLTDRALNNKFAVARVEL